jgi:large subunit ribosomal protein L10
MSKVIKQMEMDTLKHTFQDVRDLVVLSVSGLNSTVDNQLRLNLRKKNIRMQVVKNSLARRVFGELGMQATDAMWAGPTTVAWGGDSLAGLSREIETILKKNDKTIKPKGALAEGQPVTFKQALAMPTRAEAIGQVLALILGPAAQIAGQIAGPAAQIAGQIQTISEKTPPEGAAPAEGTPPAEAAPAAG